MSAVTAPLSASREDKIRLTAELSASTDIIMRRLGIVVAVILAIIILWGAFVPISSGVVALGHVGVESHRKSVQQLDGGIIREIRVREGGRVKAGSVLLRLDDTEAKLSVSVLQGEVDTLRAEQAARQAEMAGADQISFPPDLLKRAGEPNVAATIKAQKAAFEARRSNMSGRRAQLGERLSQLDRQIAGSRAQSQSRTEQIALLDSEISDVQDLYKKGLTTRTRLLALERAAAESRGERGSLDSDVAKLKAQKTEVSIATMQVGRESDTDSSDVLRKVQSDLVQAVDKLAAAKSALARTEVRAPVSGTVVGMSVTTVGGVIRPGETLMDIVPTSDNLVVTARVDPKDADSIGNGEQVNIRFDGAGMRYAPVLGGVVEKISADSLTDQRSGASYFELVVTVPEAELKRFPRHLLRPGLPAMVLVRTGSRTAFGYLFAPISKASFGAMRER